MDVSTIGSSSQVATLWRVASLASSGAAQQSQSVWGSDEVRPPEFSAAAQSMGNLAKLAQQDPDKFKQLTADMADKLKQAADQATDPQAKDRLTQLADRFKAASESGKVEDLRPQGHHGHHHHKAKGAQNASVYTQNDLASQLTGSSSNSTTLASLVQGAQTTTDGVAADGSQDTIRSLFADFDRLVASAVSG